MDFTLCGRAAVIIEEVLAAAGASGLAGLVVFCEKERHLVAQQKKALDERFRHKGHGADYVGACDRSEIQTSVPPCPQLRRGRSRWSQKRQLHPV